MNCSKTITKLDNGRKCLLLIEMLFEFVLYFLPKFRVLETTGEGGESNPCIAPIFDEIVEAPPRVEIGINGDIQRTIDLHTAKIVDRSATIGNLPPSHESKPSMDGLFDDPSIAAVLRETGSTVKFTGIDNPIQI